MRIATLQFNPQVGAVEENIRNADDLLEKGGLLSEGKGKVDLLVLPEMAFSGELEIPYLDVAMWLFLRLIFPRRDSVLFLLDIFPWVGHII